MDGQRATRRFTKASWRKWTDCLGRLVLFATIAASARAQDLVSPDGGDLGLARSLRQLQTHASLLHVVAHPDDEDSGLLAYSARGLGLRTMLFSITRGEGGANLISGDFFDRLGALRTLEHLKAASYYGNELFYSRAVDYGYSKTLTEARRQWQEGQPILADLVAVIRRERPTIVVSRFRGDDRDGHGHHQMAGVLSEQAVVAAADPSRFPEQMATGLRPWQVRKLYKDNLTREVQANPSAAWSVRVPTGDYDPWLGRSYAQVARFGLGFQRSQGFGGHEREAGSADVYYRLARRDGVEVPAARETSLLEGVTGALADVCPLDRGRAEQATLAEHLAVIDQRVADAVLAFTRGLRAPLLQELVAGHRATRASLQSLPAAQLAEADQAHLQQLLERKQRLFAHALACWAGVEFRAEASGVSTAEDASTNAPNVVGRERDPELRHANPGQKLALRLSLTQRGQEPLRIVRLEPVAPDGWKVGSPPFEPTTLAYNQTRQVDGIQVEVPRDELPTRPHWSRASIRDTLYARNQPLNCDPLPRPPLTARAEVEVLGEKITWERPVEVVYADAVLGDVRRTLQVVPAVRVGFSLGHGILPVERSEYEVEVQVGSLQSGPRQGAVRLETPAGWQVSPATAPFTLQRLGEVVRLQFQVTRPTEAREGTCELRAVVESEGERFDTDMAQVTARDLGMVHWYSPALHRIHLVDLRLPKSPSVGYIEGSGDEVAESLQWLGVAPQMLAESDLAGADLSTLDIILVGVRAYAVREDLRKYNGRLLAFVEQGGTLIVQYQTPEFDQNFGPFPYAMGNNPEEVSEEDAPVTLLAPDHPVFREPNRITPADFDGWVEQRGSKFLSTWDDRYTALLECHDHDQSPQSGGMLIAHHGRGLYVYSAYAWYRQLPNGVPGAYRMMSNLLSLPRTMAGAKGASN
jgi:LmbE family N-acetylglucosaminyl deacetylase